MLSPLIGGINMAKGFQTLREELSKLAGQYVNERMFIMFVTDSLLERLTKGKFPGRNTSHPVFVLQKKSESFIACPCTSKPQNHISYIPQGVSLEYAEPPYRLEKTGYILHKYPFVMPKDGADYLELWEYVHFRGTVPLEAIVGDEWMYSVNFL
jgi:hypothetical protein